MSNKIDCIFSLKSQLNYRFTELVASGTNLPAAQKLQSLIGTADNIDDGFYAEIKPFYEPLTAAFLSSVQTLNDAIVAGSSTPADFNEYIKLLAAALLA
jgi:hypothetical protein